MVPRHWIPIVLFAGGLSAIFAAVAAGEAEVSFVLVFPVFTGSSMMFLAGTALIILAFVTGFAMLASGQAEIERPTIGGADTEEKPGRKRTEYGGVILLGPIPIAFGSDKRIATIMLVIGIFVAILLLSLVLVLS